MNVSKVYWRIAAIPVPFIYIYCSIRCLFPSVFPDFHDDLFCLSLQSFKPVKAHKIITKCVYCVQTSSSSIDFPLYLWHVTRIVKFASAHFCESWGLGTEKDFAKGQNRLQNESYMCIDNLYLNNTLSSSDRWNDFQWRY